MIFNKLIIKNFKKFPYLEVPLNKDINIIVGNNESGKSTILEAINLVTTGKLNGKPIQTNLSTDIFNKDVVKSFINSISSGKCEIIPEIQIDLYAENIEQNSGYKGKNNLKVEDLPGISILIVFDKQYSEIFKTLVNEKNYRTYQLSFIK